MIEKSEQKVLEITNILGLRHQIQKSKLKFNDN